MRAQTLMQSAFLPGFEPAAPALLPEASGAHGGRCWIAVASAEHVRIGRAQGFMQVCHGKAAPLRRLRPGDWVAYYSPSRQFGGKDRLQAFTALGRVRAREPYAFDMGGGFVPFRRDVDWILPAQEAPIQAWLEQLSFSRGQPHWGYQLRFGLFEVSPQDMALIAQAMGVGAAWQAAAQALAQDSA